MEDGIIGRAFRKAVYHVDELLRDGTIRLSDEAGLVKQYVHYNNLYMSIMDDFESWYLKFVCLRLSDLLMMSRLYEIGYRVDDNGRYEVI